MKIKVKVNGLHEAFNIEWTSWRPCIRLGNKGDNLLDIREHVAEAGGHDDAAPEAHEAREDHRHPGVGVALLLVQPA